MSRCSCSDNIVSSFLTACHVPRRAIMSRSHRYITKFFVFLLPNPQFVPAVSAGDTVCGSTRRTGTQLAKYLNMTLEDLINL